MSSAETDNSFQAWRLPMDITVPFEEVEAALIASETAIPAVLMACYQNRSALSVCDFYAMGIARRAIALSSGFRSMLELRNSLCALPIVRMQLDTALRMYAGFFAPDHFIFCERVMEGEQIDRLKADDGKLMRDRYLLERVAQTNPWMRNVYKLTSGYIHFSERHIFEALKNDPDGGIQMIIGPTDHDRKAVHFHEPARCMHHLNLIIEEALRDWLRRMCVPAPLTN